MSLAINSFNKANARTISDALMVAMRDTAATYGIVLEKNGGTVDDLTCILKFRAMIDPARRNTDKKVLAAAKAAWASKCSEYGLKPEHFGMEIATPRGEYKLEEIDVSKKRNVGMRRLSDGVRFWTSAEEVAKHLSGVQPATKGAIAKSPKVAASTKKPVTKKELIADVSSLSQQFGNLRVRWQDEKEYEDFADYITAGKKIAKTIGAELVSMTKSFVIVLQRGDEAVKMVIRAGKAVLSKTEVAAPKKSKKVAAVVDDSDDDLDLDGETVARKPRRAKKVVGKKHAAKVSFAEKMKAAREAAKAKRDGGKTTPKKVGTKVRATETAKPKLTKAELAAKAERAEKRAARKAKRLAAEKKAAKATNGRTAKKPAAQPAKRTARSTAKVVASKKPAAAKKTVRRGRMG